MSAFTCLGISLGESERSKRNGFRTMLCFLIFFTRICTTASLLTPGVRSLQGTSMLIDSELSQSFHGFRPSKVSKRDTRLFASTSTSADDKERALGISVLLTVPLAWGTYSPVVKYLYEVQPPVPGIVFSALYYMVASVSLSALVFMQKQPTDQANKEEVLDDGFPFMGGIELGSYLFVANALQVIGLKTVPADRAGFLVQLTTVLVPLLSATLAGNILAIPIRTWGACLLAFSGVIIMGIDGKDMSQDSTAVSLFVDAFTSFTQGDLLIVGAAFIYSLHVVRLGRYAKETTPLKLAASKATTETFLSVGLVAVLCYLGNSAEDSSGVLAYASRAGSEISVYFSFITEGITSGAIPTSALLPAAGAVLWTGWVTCAYTIYAQSFGQRRVSPTNANLIYTIQPLFTALFAFVLLGETLGSAGLAGGGLIASGLYLVSTDNGEEDINSSMGDSQLLPEEENVLIDTQGVVSSEETSKELLKR